MVRNCKAKALPRRVTVGHRSVTAMESKWGQCVTKLLIMTGNSTTEHAHRCSNCREGKWVAYPFPTCHWLKHFSGKFSIKKVLQTSKAPSHRCFQETERVSATVSHFRMCMWLGAKGGIFLDCCLPCFWHRSLHWIQIHQQAELSPQQAPGIHLSLSPQLWAYKWAIAGLVCFVLLLCECGWDKLRYSWLLQALK